MANGYVYTYAAGTTTNPKDTYTTAAGNVANANPIRLDSNGEAEIFWDGAYNIAVHDANDALVYTVDNYIEPSSLIASLRSDMSASTGAGLIGWCLNGISSFKRWVIEKLADVISVKDFGAVGDGVADDSAAIQAAINSGKALWWPDGTYRLASSVSTDQTKLRWYSRKAVILSDVASGYAITLGTTSASKYDLLIDGLRFERSSGTHYCLDLYEQLHAKIAHCHFTGFQNYSIHAKACDGLKLIRNRIYTGSVKLENQMDNFAFVDNEVSGSTNKPCLEVYGGYSGRIVGNFFTWSNHEAIVLGYDSIRGDYANNTIVDGNYIERCCQTDTGSAYRPFIYVGTPYDQSGTAYSGSLRAVATRIANNRLNADVLNPNLSNSVPIILEYSDSTRYVDNISDNFTGASSKNRIQVKAPARNHYLGAGELVNELSVGSPSARQQVRYPTYGAYAGAYMFYLETHTSGALDGTGAGSYSILATTTKFGTSASKVKVFAFPVSNCQLYASTPTINVGASGDGSDQAAITINIRGGTAGGTVTFNVVGYVLP